MLELTNKLIYIAHTLGQNIVFLLVDYLHKIKFKIRPLKVTSLFCYLHRVKLKTKPLLKATSLLPSKLLEKISLVAY